MWSRLWITIDKWGPAATAGICLAVVAVLGWAYSSRLSYEHGVNTSQQSQINLQTTLLNQEIHNLRAERKQEIDDLRKEITSLRNWSIAVYERSTQAGIALPPIPEREKSKHE